MSDDIPPMSLRAALAVLGLITWFVTQHLIKHRPSGHGVIGDGLHTLTAPVFRFFTAKPVWAEWLLITSSMVIDCLGLFVLAWSIVGPSVGPLIGIAILFSLRQICQLLCALPAPEGMIWRPTRVPTMLVTYGVANDLFFSGHTAMAVYAAIELVRWGGNAWLPVGVFVAVFEIFTVIVLRAHYTMDVYAAIMTAIVAVFAADALAPWCDQWLIQFGQQVFGG